MHPVAMDSTSLSILPALRRRRFRYETSANVIAVLRVNVRNDVEALGGG